MNNTYQKIKDDLTSKEKFHIKLGIERVSEVLEFFDNPQNKIETIHIAGTNGKGSTSAMLAKILETSGYSTGLFTSPHLVKYNERIKISSVDISDTDLENVLNRVNSAAKEKDIYLTEFEILTVAAFLYFCEKKVDIAIIEVGLGGRLDATNVITPLFEIITSISLDHTERLGNTIEKIAFEKAGIIKPGSTVIINENNAGLETVKKVAQKTGANLKLAPTAEYAKIKNGFNEIKINEKINRTNLLGSFQGENLSLVLTSLELLLQNKFTLKDIEKALLEVSWAARMQFLAPNVILDGAHNPAAAKALRQTLDENFNDRPIIWFFGALKNKDYEANVKILFKNSDIVYFVNLNLQNACGSKEFKSFTGRKNRYNITIDDFNEVYNSVKNEENLVIICGSLYLAGEILA